MTEQGHHQVSSLVSDLVEMAEATRKLPQLEAQVQRLEYQVGDQRETIASRELRIIELKAREDELLGKLRSVEAERDEATFRLLETDDRNAATISILSSIRKECNELIVVLTGSEKTDMVFMTPAQRSEYEGYLAYQAKVAEELAAKEAATKMVPTPEETSAATPQLQAVAEPTGWTASEAVTSEPWARPEDRPTDNNWLNQGRQPGGKFGPKQKGDEMFHTQGGFAVAGEGEASPTSEVPSQSMEPVQDVGQRAEDPTVQKETIQSPPVPSTTADSKEPVSSEASEAEIHGEFYGKKYYNTPRLISEKEWLSGGGTLADYHWRPWDDKAAE